jgi:hypothetical protein
MANPKTDPPSPVEDKVMTIKLRAVDQSRLATARDRTGIGSDTDVIRHALAKLCEQWEPTAPKGGAR